jgi:O-antigen/teichoic acid export membrane protein
MRNSHGTLKVLFWGGCVSLTGSIMVGLFNYLIRRHLAINLPAEAYGFLYGAFSLLMLLMAFMDFGMTQGGTILIAQARATGQSPKSNSFYSLMLLARAGTGTVFFLILIVLSPWLTDIYYKYPEGKYAFIALTLLLILQSTEGIALAGLDAVKAFTIKNIILTVRCLILLVGIYIFTSPNGLFGVAAMFPFCALLSLMTIYIVSSHKFGLKIVFSQAFAPETIKQTWHLCRWIALSLAGITTIYSIDSLMLTWFCGLQDVALYNIALPIVQIMQTLIILPIVFTPVVSELWQQNKTDEIGKLVNAVTVCLIIILCLLIVGIIPTASIIISILFAPQFVAAASPLIILSLGVVFYAAANFYLSALNSGGKAFHAAVLMIGGAILSIIANLVFIPKFGINGAAFSTTLSYLFICIVSFAILSKRIHMHIPRKRLLYIMSCGISGVCLAVAVAQKNLSLQTTIGLTAILLSIESLLLAIPAWRVLQDLLKFYRDKQTPSK